MTITAELLRATIDPYHEFPLSPYEFREANSFTVQRTVSVYPFSGIFAELQAGSDATSLVTKEYHDMLHPARLFSYLFDPFFFLS